VLTAALALAALLVLLLLAGLVLVALVHLVLQFAGRAPGVGVLLPLLVLGVVLGVVVVLALFRVLLVAVALAGLVALLAVLALLFRLAVLCFVFLLLRLAVALLLLQLPVLFGLVFFLILGGLLALPVAFLLVADRIDDGDLVALAFRHVGARVVARIGDFQPVLNLLANLRSVRLAVLVLEGGEIDEIFILQGSRISVTLFAEEILQIGLGQQPRTIDHLHAQRDACQAVIVGRLAFQLEQAVGRQLDVLAGFGDLDCRGAVVADDHVMGRGVAIGFALARHE